MQKILLASLLTLLFAGCATADEPLSATKHGGSIYFGDYEPRDPKSLDELPEMVRTKLKLHLQARLGKDFYARLRFVGGQIINIEELHSADPSSKNYKWEVPAYRLGFEFNMPEAGIESYTADISLRQDGSVLEEIDLPSFSSDPRKLNFIAAQTAFDNTVKTGLIPKERSGVAIEYLRDKDILVWRFTQKMSEDRDSGQEKIIDINMHTGELVHTLTRTIDY